MSLKGRVDKPELATRREAGTPATIFCIPDNGRGEPGPGVYETTHAVTVIYPPELPAGRRWPTPWSGRRSRWGRPWPGR